MILGLDVCTTDKCNVWMSFCGMIMWLVFVCTDCVFILSHSGRYMSIVLFCKSAGMFRWMQDLIVDRFLVWKNRSTGFECCNNRQDVIKDSIITSVGLCLDPHLALLRNVTIQQIFNTVCNMILFDCLFSSSLQHFIHEWNHVLLYLRHV